MKSRRHRHRAPRLPLPRGWGSLPGWAGGRRGRRGPRRRPGARRAPPPRARRATSPSGPPAPAAAASPPATMARPSCRFCVGSRDGTGVRVRFTGDGFVARQGNLNFLARPRCCLCCGARPCFGRGPDPGQMMKSSSCQSLSRAQTQRTDSLSWPAQLSWASLVGVARQMATRRTSAAEGFCGGAGRTPWRMTRKLSKPRAALMVSFPAAAHSSVGSHLHAQDVMPCRRDVQSGTAPSSRGAEAGVLRSNCPCECSQLRLL